MPEFMNPFLQKMRHLGEGVETFLKRAWQGIERPFLSKAEVARRASGQPNARQLRELEAERLDRIRNPRDYQGR